MIILSIHDDENYVTHALKTGALGYLLKEMDADALIEAVKIVAEWWLLFTSKGNTDNLVTRISPFSFRAK